MMRNFEQGEFQSELPEADGETSDFEVETNGQEERYEVEFIPLDEAAAKLGGSVEVVERMVMAETGERLEEWTRGGEGQLWLHPDLVGIIRVKLEALGESMDVHQLYYNEMVRHKLLSAKEERYHTKQMHKYEKVCTIEGRHEFEKHRDKLVNANLRWAYTQARLKDGQGLPLMDKVQAMNLGLIRASKDFDPDIGRLTTYSTHWMREIGDRTVWHEAHAVPKPVHMLEKIDKLQKQRDLIFAQTGRKATEAELKEALGMDEESFRKVVTAAEVGTVSLDQPGAHKDEPISKQSEMIRAQVEDPAKEAMRAGLKSAADQILVRVLNPQQYQVVVMYYGLNGTGRGISSTEVARRLGVSRARAHKVIRTAQEKLAKEESFVALYQMLKDCE